jgi:hypothetical protein
MPSLLFKNIIRGYTLFLQNVKIQPVEGHSQIAELWNNKLREILSEKMAYHSWLTDVSIFLT